MTQSDSFDAFNLSRSCTESSRTWHVRAIACPTRLYTRAGMGDEEEEEDQGCASRLTRQATRESVINTVTPETMGFRDRVIETSAGQQPDHS